MMKPHCDRCDARIDDGFSKWIETPFVHQDGAADTIRKSVWHVTIHEGGDVARLYEKMFCRRCTLVILEQYVKELRLVAHPAGNGHLADCAWNASMRRYDCADGCDIKRLNAGTKTIEQIREKIDVTAANDEVPTFVFTGTTQCRHPMALLIDDQERLCTEPLGHDGPHRWLLERAGHEPWYRKCDRGHAGPLCADPECWLIDDDGFRSAERGCS